MTIRNRLFIAVVILIWLFGVGVVGYNLTPTKTADHTKIIMNMDTVTIVKYMP